MKLLLPAVFLLVSILPGALFARPNAETKAQLRELIIGYDPAVLSIIVWGAVVRECRE